MPRAKKKRHHPKTASVQTGDGSVAISGSVANSNIFTGNNNQVIQQIVGKQLVVSLFTIPAPVGDFTGREKELADLKAAFKRGEIIASVTGGSGIGKTELARKLAQELAGNFPDARMSIDLLGTSEKPLTSEEAMRRLLEPFYPNQKLSDDPTQLQGLFQRTFTNKKALLLLDNAANAGQVRPLIPPAPSAVIITSRQHFSLTEFGLQIPFQLSTLSPEKSREFLRRSSAKLLNSTDNELDQLAYLCGWLPLALRVVVSLLNDRNDWELDILISNLADERTRLQTLKRPDDEDLDVEAAIGLSYKQLEPEYQKHFRALGVFSTPFWHFTASAVWGIDYNMNENQTQQILGRLISRSLIITYPSPLIVQKFSKQKPKTLPFYLLHDLTRLYAKRLLLVEVEEAKECLSNYAEYLVDMAKFLDRESVRDARLSRSSIYFFSFFWPEINDVWKKMLPEEKVWPKPESAISWLWKFPRACERLVSLILPPRQLISFISIGISAAQEMKQKRDEGALISDLAHIYTELGETSNALENYKKAFAIAKEAEDKVDEASAMYNLANFYNEIEEWQEAILIANRALALIRKSGDHFHEAQTLGCLGNSYFISQDYEQASRYYDSARHIARQHGYMQIEGDMLGSLGNICMSLNPINPTKAIGYYEHALKIEKRVGEQLKIAATLLNMSTPYANIGDTEKAIESVRQALIILEKYESPKIAEGKRLLSRWQTEDNIRKAIRISLRISQRRGSDAESYYKETVQVLRDPRSSSDQKLFAKVLQSILVGVQTPDFTGLPDELVLIIKDELEKNRKK